MVEEVENPPVMGVAWLDGRITPPHDPFIVGGLSAAHIAMLAPFTNPVFAQVEGASGEKFPGIATLSDPVALIGPATDRELVALIIGAEIDTPALTDPLHVKLPKPLTFAKLHPTTGLTALLPLTT
jgi:hypothetical protein